MSERKAAHFCAHGASELVGKKTKEKQLQEKKSLKSAGTEVQDVRRVRGAL